MPEPLSLEQIAADVALVAAHGEKGTATNAAAARLLLTAIEQSDEHGERLDSHNRVMTSLVERVRKLESPDAEPDAARLSPTALNWRLAAATESSELFKAERDEARAVVERLRAGLLRWDVSHADDCTDEPCTCGLADALKEATDA